MLSPIITVADLADFRADAEQNMIDTCIITRAGTGNGPWNESTGQYDPPARITIYTGMCRFQDASIANAAASVVDAGERAAAIQGGELQLPVAGTGVVSVDDVAEILTSATDPERVGRKYTIAARFEKTHATSRRLRLVEVTG